jgi:7-cyano-7-deazaguanine synthase
MNRNNKIVILLSGGMDSATLLAYYLKAGWEPHALIFNYNQKHSREIGHALMLCNHYTIDMRVVYMTEFDWLKSAQTDTSIAIPEGHYTEESMKVTVTPNRNMLMLSIAASYAISLEADNVGYAAHAGDHTIYPDCRPDFADSMRRAMAHCHFTPVYLHTPFITYSKAEILRLGLRLDVPYELTWSCYKGRDKPCGKCGTCVERLEAFHLNGIEDPLTYEDREWWKTQTKKEKLNE